VPGLRGRLTGLTVAIDHLASFITVAILGVVVVCNGLEILQRGLFSWSFQWLYECNLLATAWMYFLGMILVYSRGKDITLDFLLMVLHGRARRIYLVAVNTVATVTFLTVGWYGVLLMRLQLPFRTTGYHIPNALFTLPVVVAAVAISVILARQSLDIWAGDDPHARYARPGGGA
jgi:TRAP-type C4-dicarboxylate transport system permease small subunit